jgi:hypothetical protein
LGRVRPIGQAAHSPLPWHLSLICGCFERALGANMESYHLTVRFCCRRDEADGVGTDVVWLVLAQAARSAGWRRLPEVLDRHRRTRQYLAAAQSPLSLPLHPQQSVHNHRAYRPFVHRFAAGPVASRAG